MNLAISEGLAGPASQRLSSLLSPASRARLIAQDLLETSRHRTYVDILETLGRVLDGAAVNWAVLKGPVLAEVAYAGGARGYTDLDLLVAPGQFETAVRALAEAGVIASQRDWPPSATNLKGELSLLIAGLPVVDLHWHLVYLHSARERFQIPTEALLERRQQVVLQGVSAWVLEPTDFVIHVALHASFAGVHRLRRLLDIERTIIYRPPDWDLLVERCRAWKTQFPVAVMLQSAQRTLGASVPSDVLRELAGTGLGHVVANQLSAWVPSGRLPGGRAIRTGLTRCLRDNWRATSAEFARETWRIATRTSPARKQPPDRLPAILLPSDWLPAHLPADSSPADSSPADSPPADCPPNDSPPNDCPPADCPPATGALSDPSALQRYMDLVHRTDRYGHTTADTGVRAPGGLSATPHVA